MGTRQLWKDGAGWQKPLAEGRKSAGNSCRVQRRGQLVLARVTMPASACADLDRASMADKDQNLPTKHPGRKINMCTLVT